ncbi:bifunctional hydroxymethylpyrimidine kinase/phosphomethylpyrimidine kinase [Microbacterium hominis]|uniref:bifunctional hydroxymethylpyrimidine kinase/phosphomethylpyrimidine kinase n=1 Tax=Microbacterium hominis TaxID=162426 RepID=UPI00076897E2|nr:bifunctional hydroxymethylpyrimidine kinase/phosphomethylpyrimidine kinase [Microbacterium hominis]KXC05686.1 hydroxymethylpyrimidine kinase [Microbacterium hominis]
MTAGIPRVLSIAGTDPTGGAGIQADLKSIGALGGYGMAVVTVLAAQNTRGVRTLHAPPTAFLDEQLRAVSDDVEIDAVKIGMLLSGEIAGVVEAWLTRVRPPVVVLDPVMVATSGDRLLDAEAVAAVRRLCRRAHLVTPNLPELAVLVDAAPATSWPQAVAQAERLHRETGTAVLLKGGHLDGAASPDAIVDADGVHEVSGIRVMTRHTHGTGCSLSSAMATLGAAGMPWPAALARAKAWLTGALQHADALRVGEGDGPVDHFHELRPALRDGAPWSAGVWRLTSTVRADVDACDLVTGLGDGSLDLDRFHRYLAQDALYLRAYSRVLARAAELAADGQERAFWTEASASCLLEEERLHRVRIGEAHPEPGPATRGYLAHFDRVVAGGSSAELVAAVLPCFWLYADLGTRLAPLAHDAHPYADWLRAYGDPAFAEATRRAIAIADAAVDAASPDDRDRMSAAFERSMRHELAFFDAP